MRVTTTVVGVVRVIGGGTSAAGREISATVTGLALDAGAATATGAPVWSMPGIVAGSVTAEDGPVAALVWLAAFITSTLELKITATVMTVSSTLRYAKPGASNGSGYDRGAWMSFFMTTT